MKVERNQTNWKRSLKGGRSEPGIQDILMRFELNAPKDLSLSTSLPAFPSHNLELEHLSHILTASPIIKQRALPSFFLIHYLLHPSPPCVIHAFHQLEIRIIRPEKLLRLVHRRLDIFQQPLHLGVLVSPRAPLKQDASEGKNVVQESLQLGFGDVGETLVGKAEVETALSQVVGAVDAAHYESVDSFAGPGASCGGVVEPAEFGKSDGGFAFHDLRRGFWIRVLQNWGLKELLFRVFKHVKITLRFP